MLSIFAKKKLCNPIASYDDRLEFQVERIIIWVYINNSLGIEKSIKKANNSFDYIWNDRGSVIELAEAESRKLSPGIWKVHDSLGILEHPLSVCGIWYFPDIDVAHYEVNINHDYRYGEGVPEFEEESITVTRDSESTLSI